MGKRVVDKGRKPGRPKLDIDLRNLPGLIRIQCTAEECAAALDCSVDTLDRAIKETHGVGFADFRKRYASEGRASLRRLQWNAAKAGDRTMLIWLGKQYLDQSDKSEVSGKGGGPIRMISKDMTEREAAEAYAATLHGESE